MFVETTIKSSLSDLAIAFENASNARSTAPLDDTRRSVLEVTYERVRRLHAASAWRCS
jgi:hypothetical protein